MGLADQLDRDPYAAEAWVPKEAGEVLIGKITGFGTRITEYQPDGYLIIQIDDLGPEGGTTAPGSEIGKQWAVHAFHYVLEQEVRKYKLKVGNEIGFKFLGKPEGKNYVAYRVVSDAEIIMPGDSPEQPVASDVPSDFQPSSTPVPSGVSSVTDDDIPF